MHLGPLILQTLIALCIFQALDIADVNNFFPFWLSELQIALLGKASMQKIFYISHRLSQVNPHLDYPQLDYPQLDYPHLD